MSRTKKPDIQIGLEMHVQLTSLRTKLFCGCSADYRGNAPNTNICPICMGLPGTLPVLNQKAVHDALLVSPALNSNTSKRMMFFRKNYYYPDMPKNFQITQFDRAGGVPFATGGQILIDKRKIIRIRRIQLEEDPAKLVYKGTIDSSTSTLVDYNRAGIALVEIVTEPDLTSPRDARVFLGRLRSILEYLGVSDGRLEGSMRCDANISLAGGTRVEIKNISSFKEVERALKFEITRQKSRVEKGIRVKRETRHWDEARRITVSLRVKEEEQDYRYFPEPDLVPIVISDKLIENIRKMMPELPEIRQRRLVEQYGISLQNAKILASNKDLADFFEQCTKWYSKANEISNWLVGDLLANLHERDLEISNMRIAPKLFSDLLKLINGGKISKKIAKSVLREMIDTGKMATTIIEEEGLRNITDLASIKEVVNKIFQENSEAVKASLKDEDAINYLIGQVMKSTKGQADPMMVNEVVRKKLSEISAYQKEVKSESLRNENKIKKMR